MTDKMPAISCWKLVRSLIGGNQAPGPSRLGLEEHRYRGRNMRHAGERASWTRTEVAWSSGHVSQRTGGSAGEIHWGQAGKALLVFQRFPSAEHKTHRHALCALQLGDHWKLGRLCIKMQNPSFSANVRKPGDTASIILQNECRRGEKSNCSQRMQTLSSLPQSQQLPAALMWGLRLHRCFRSSFCSSLCLRQGLSHSVPTTVSHGHTI